MDIAVADELCLLCNKLQLRHGIPSGLYMAQFEVIIGPKLHIFTHSSYLQRGHNYWGCGQ